MSVLLHRLDGWFAEAVRRDLLPEAMRAPLDAALHAAASDGLERPIDPLLVIMLCGPTAVGKSSLLNALAGAEIAAVGLGATTDRPLIYLHEDDDPARLFAYGQAIGELASDRAGVVRHARAELRGKAIVDTPDIDSAVREHRAATEAAAMHADIVLYVTSPEKYKVEEPLRWLAGHRQRRGIGFVLNKWDAAGMGRQFALRAGVEADFRALIATFGFVDPHLFFVSSREGGDGLASLRDWITGALDRSAAMAIGALRRRAGWGEIAAALSAARATLTAEAEDARHVTALWSAAAAAARQDIEADAARLATLPAPTGYRPRSGGLIGLAASTLPHWPRLLAATAAASPAGPFGGTAPGALERAAGEVELYARMRGLRLGAVADRFAPACAALAQELAAVPTQAEAAEVAANLNARVRRAIAALWLGVADLAIVGVLALTLWRLASDFVRGSYAPLSLLVSAAAIAALVAAFGQLGVRLLFPGLSRRIATAARRRGTARLDAAAATLTGATVEQIDAAIRLRAEATDLLAAIDREIAALADPAEADPAAARLFATARFD